MENVNITFNLLKPLAPDFPLCLLWRPLKIHLQCNIIYKKYYCSKWLSCSVSVASCKAAFYRTSEQTDSVVQTEILCSPVHLTIRCTDCLGARQKTTQSGRTSEVLHISMQPRNQPASHKANNSCNDKELQGKQRPVAKMGSLLCSIPLPGHMLPSLLLQHRSL